MGVLEQQDKGGGHHNHEKNREGEVFVNPGVFI